MILTYRALRAPMNDTNLRDFAGFLLEMSGSQAVAASADVALLRNGSAVVGQDCQITDAYIVSPKVAAAGESMSVDVQKSVDGGATWATVLTAPRVFGSTDTNMTQISLASLLDMTKIDLPAGAMLRAHLVYTAGGGPTPLVNFLVAVNPGGLKHA